MKGRTMAKRGFWAEMQHQAKLAEQRQARANREAARANAAAQREAARTAAAAERARVAQSRATEAERRQAERAATKAHQEAQAADAAAKTAAAAEVLDEIAGMLAATITVDDYVDLESLRQRAHHPPFTRADLEAVTPQPDPILTPPPPVYVAPAEPSGLSARMGGRRRYEAELANAQAAFHEAYQQWQAYCALIPGMVRQQGEAYNAREHARLSELEAERTRYQSECAQRDAEVSAANADLDRIIHGVPLGVQSAVQDYISIVLGNSVYPDSFSVEHDFEFDSNFSELRLVVHVPPPSEFPSSKEFRYVKTSDEIVEKSLAARDLKNRYRDAIAQVSVRTLHEVFEADRSGTIGTISLNVGTNTINPATGQRVAVPFVAVAARREDVLALDLNGVVPSATLAHFRAVVSKDPYGLVAIDTSSGVRG